MKTLLFPENLLVYYNFFYILNKQKINNNLYTFYLNYLKTNILLKKINKTSLKIQYKFKNKSKQFNIKNNKLYYENKKVVKNL